MSDLLSTSRQENVVIAQWHDNENRLNANSVAALNNLLDDVENTQELTTLVVTGSGKFFSNGLDLEWMGTVPDEAPAFLENVHRLLRRFTQTPVLTVAAINGHAFAGGAMFSAAHDFLFMREDRGYWCLPEADLGLPLTPMMHAVVEAKLNRRTYHEAIMTAKRYNGQEAKAAGIVHELATEDTLLPQAIAFAQQLSIKQRNVVIEHKRLLYSHLNDVSL